MASNGRLSSSALMVVQNDGTKLALGAGRAFLKLVAAAKEDGHTIRIAGPAGGYRSFAVQGDMRRNPGKYGLNPHSSVPLAAPGWSTHGFGTRVDLVGAPLDYIIRVASRFGFTREFGSRDPNHFMHDGKTAISAPKAHKRPGLIEYTSDQGKPNSTYYKNLQWFARVDGGYDGPLDGKLGEQSWTGVQKALEKHGFFKWNISGKFDVATRKGLQLWAAENGGYDGPIDGKLGANSYASIGRALNKVH